MASSSDNQKIEKKMENINLKKDDMSAEDKYMIDILDELDENETDLDKIAKASHQFLLANAIKNADRVLTKSEEEGKVFFNDEEKRKNKKKFLIKFCFEESFKMLKDKLLE